MSVKAIRSTLRSLLPVESIRNVSTVMGGTLIAQTLALLVSPILSRLYTPSDYGIAALYWSITSILAIVATARYELAVVLPASDDDAVHVVVLSLIICATLSLLSLVGAVFLRGPLVRILNIGRAQWILYTLPLVTLLTGTLSTLSNWANRKKKYPRIMVTRISQSFASTGVSVTGGLLHVGSSGLIVADLAGQAVSVGVLGFRIGRGSGWRLRSISGARLKEVARRYADLPKINLVHAFVDTLASSALRFLMSGFWGDSVLGSYAFVIRILNAPVTLFGSAIAQVLFQRASHAFNEGADLGRLVRKTFVILSALSLPICLVFIIFAPAIFGTVFGAQWTEAGVFARILSIWFLFRFIVSPLSQIPIIVGKQGISFLFGIIYQASLLVPVVAAGWAGAGMRSALWMSVLASSTVLAVNAAWILKISHGRRAVVAP